MLVTVRVRACVNKLFIYDGGMAGSRLTLHLLIASRASQPPHRQFTMSCHSGTESKLT